MKYQNKGQKIMFKFCGKYVSNYKKQLTLYLLISIISTIITVLIPVYWGKIINLMTTSHNIPTLLQIGCFVLLLGIFNILIRYWNNRFYLVIQTNSAMDISADIIHHLHKISLNELQKYDIGYLNESINSDSNSITMFFLSVLINALSNGLFLILSLLILYSISFKIGFTLLFFITIYVLFFLCFRNKLMIKSESFKNARSYFFGALFDQFKNIKYIKQHALENLFKDKLKHDFDIFFKKALDVQQFFYLYSSADDVLETIVNFCIYILGGISVMYGNMTIGGFTIILNFYNSIISSIKYFVNLGKEYQDNNVSYMRLLSYLNLSEQKNGIEIPSNILTISCENLSFSRNDKKILQEFNFTFYRGEIYCIQGENGSGKTTLIDLLIGLFIGEYDGEIFFNDINIKKIDMSNMRQCKISILEQDPYLLEGSLKDNIHLTKEHCENKYFSRFIKKEIRSIGKNGEGISGGERQKIGIVRTLAKHSDLLIFDEPTSALDRESKVEFFNLLKEIKKEKIIIFISHDRELNNVADHIIDMSLMNSK